MNGSSRQPEILRPCAELSGVRLLCCDIDGVMTDGSFFYDASGVALMRFHVLDGMGLKSIMAAGIETCFISQSQSSIIAKRAEILSITHCLLGIDDKQKAIAELISSKDYSLEAICHIADDINDLTLLRCVGVAVAVPNAVDEVMRTCRFVTTKSGGNGAVRELCDAILMSKM